MANKKIKSLDDAPVDVVEAIKRAFIHRGFIPRRRRSTVKASDLEAKASASQSAAEDDEPASGPEQLADLTDTANELLFEATTIFPFTLFPDTVTLDREKVTVANRVFFKVAKINSVAIADIQTIEANVGPFFGSIKVLRINMAPIDVNAPIAVRFLWRADAIKLQHLIQGYMLARRKKIDCTAVDKEQLLIMLNDLGQGVSD
jgi:hypothetical protein